MEKLDQYYMDKTLEIAKASLKFNEVPVGALIVKDESIISSAYNTKVKSNNPLGHAEINAIHEAVNNTGNLYLNGLTMYVTLEPCIMCAGAILLARISRLVIGCLDEKTGAFGSLYDFSEDKRLNHKIEVLRNIREEECSRLLKDFFKKLRGYH